MPRICNSINLCLCRPSTKDGLQKMVKLSTMESETEVMENWTIFWRFFNDVIRLSQKDGALIKQEVYGNH